MVYLKKKHIFIIYIKKYLHKNRRQTDNKLRCWAILDGKINHCKFVINGFMRHDIVMHDLLNFM